MRKNAYTLLELLVALTIVLVLAGLLAPVFILAKEEARQAACAVNFKQTNLSSTLYQIDYDDRFVVSRYRGGSTENAMTDRTWVQLVQPYLRTLDSTRCPSDYTRGSNEKPVFDEDLGTGNSVERFYAASQRANTGYNFIYLAPVIRESNGTWFAKPRSASDLQDPGQTLIFGDSVWEVEDDARPAGGGSYLISPPCRYVSPNSVDSFDLNGIGNDRVYSASKEWDDTGPNRRVRAGGLWAWHSGRLTVVMGDGSVRAISLERASEGCTVRRGWSGRITDTDRYIWDLR